MSLAIPNSEYSRDRPRNVELRDVLTVCVCLARGVKSGITQHHRAALLSFGGRMRTPGTHVEMRIGDVAAKPSL